MTHDEFMRCALDIITEPQSFVAPNPRVGCVIVRDDQIIGRGSSRPPGGNHAEIEALEDAARNGHDVKGATVYVTLEPCSHHGRTPPCTDALIKSGVSRVVAAMTDPDSRVSGEGFSRLIAAGIDVISGVLQHEAREMNAGFLSRMERGRPWVRMKIAASLDGRTALTNGESQWITSEIARQDGHSWRARADAILTGIGTVQNDNPLLNVRNTEIPSQPRRIVVDSRLNINPDARVLSGEKTWVFCAVANPKKVEALESAGAEIIIMPDKNWAVDLAAMMQELGRRGVNEVHVEAGSVLNGALLRAGCVDELLVYMAPSLIGEGRGMCSMLALESLENKINLHFHEITTIGPEIRIIARLA